MEGSATADTPRLRAGFAVFVLALLCLFTAPLFADLVNRSAPRAADGVLDLSGVRPLNAPVALIGKWDFAWLSLPSKDAPVGLMKVPGEWSGKTVSGRSLPSSGAASYSLTVRGLPAGRYVLHVAPLYAATRVWIDDELISEQGRFGRSAATTRYGVRAHEVPIRASGQDIKIRIDVSSFHHRDNGIEKPPVLGTVAAMVGWTSLEWTQSLLYLAAAFLIAVYGLVVFLFRRQDRASLFLALSFLAATPITFMFSHDNLLSVILPDIEFRYMVFLQYGAGALVIAFFAAYVDALFPDESPRLGLWVVQAAFALLLVGQFVLFLQNDTLGASQLSKLAEPVRLAVFAYLIGVAILAATRRRESALIFLIGVTALLLTLALRAAVSNSFIAQNKAEFVEVSPIGLLVFLFAQIIILAERWSIAIRTAETTSSDLRTLLDVNSSITSEIRLEELLRKIVSASSRIVDADRSSLFLHDVKTDELWSVVAEGVETRSLRFSTEQGLAGASFRSGEIINVEDAYEHPSFNRAIDSETGYRTGSILTLPVVAKDGRRLGVMQALNHRTGQAFTEDDIARMQAFGAQAAIAIDNATLFAEVSAARNYNESILRSMSSGVITIDRDNEVSKLNRAACKMLKVDPDAARDAQSVLLQSNPWLAAELEEVAATGSAKSLLDADFVTGDGSLISVNLAIVPLVLDGLPIGVLILFEDISEGKRLQSAMRRFLTQEVVDQVMERSELLFGSACDVSVLFADIRNFTTMAESLDPRSTVDMLNEIFTELFEAVAASGGVLDKFMGDAIMAVYGAPLSTGHNPQSAVESALKMFQLLGNLNAIRESRGAQRIRLGIGIATGEVVAGTIGSPKRMEYTVIGDSVNLASRLQDLTKQYGVEMIVCDATAAAIEGRVALRELDLIRVRGRSRPTRIFEVLSGNAPDGPDFAKCLDQFEVGREYLRRGEWQDAVLAFEKALALGPTDRPSRVMLDRARKLAAEPPPADWDGVWGS